MTGYAFIGFIFLMTCMGLGWHIGYIHGYDVGMLDGGPDGILTSEEYKMGVIENERLQLELDIANKSYVSGYETGFIDGIQKGVVLND